MTMNLSRDSKSLCEREVTFAPGKSLPRGSSLSRVHVNRPLEKSPTVWKEKCRKFSIYLFQRDRGQLEKSVFLCCFMSIFAKTLDVYCIFNNETIFSHYGHFDKIFWSLLLMLDHHQNFECLASQGLLLTFGLFQGYSLGYSYLLTNWFAYLYGRIQSPRPDVMPDRREGKKGAGKFQVFSPFLKAVTEAKNHD